MEQPTNSSLKEFEKDMPNLTFSREGLEELLKRRFFITPSFSIYNGVAGLYDYGPPGCAVKSNLLDFWRQHFVLYENMLEVDCTCVTPEEVLIASEHVKKFLDFMVKDTVSNNCYRADHLLKEHLTATIAATTDKEKIAEYEHVIAVVDEYKEEELGNVMEKYGVKSPEGNAISRPYPFNLMFGVQIGPSGTKKGYLRPETAQGIFVNFKKLLEYNGGKLPFAAAQVGLAFRNEIAPRAGVLRVREFQMAEIEHFVKEDEKDHPRFAEIKDLKMHLYPIEYQLSGEKKLLYISVGDAVARGIIGNQTLAYFMARTHLFLTGAGVRLDGLRFRQHLRNEMAHYAKDCWDAEIKSSYDWVECVGHADRSCFDLTQHTKASKEDLVAYERFDKPRMMRVVKAKPNKGTIGPGFKAAAKDIYARLEALTESEVLAIRDAFQAHGEAPLTVGATTHTLKPNHVIIEEKDENRQGQNFVPHVIEPSFGIGRIVYSILEHAYYARTEDAQKRVLSLPARIAPVKCSVLPLRSNPQIEALIPKISRDLTLAGLSNKVDATGTSIGRRYSRTDEIGVPFGITVDFDTLTDNAVTLRERDTRIQIRVPIAELPALVSDLCNGRKEWSTVSSHYPHQQAPSDD